MSELWSDKHKFESLPAHENSDWTYNLYEDIQCLKEELEEKDKRLEAAAKAIELLESDGLMFLDVTRIALAKYKELTNET